MTPKNVTAAGYDVEKEITTNIDLLDQHNVIIAVKYVKGHQDRKRQFGGRVVLKHILRSHGFTGTSVWVDPVRKLCGVLLTNRVYPTSENKKIQHVRPKFYDAVVQAENKE